MNDHPKPTTADYAPINGTKLYYEIHGSGQPLLLLHGGMTSLADFGFMLPTFAKTRQAIAFDRQGHGRTADSDRPFTLENWADEAAALLDHLNIKQADVLGYSTGGEVALAFAMRHPKRVRKLVLISAIYNNDGYYPGILEGLKQAKANDLPPIMREMYEQFAPRPQDWENLVKKSVKSAATFSGWQKKDLRAISAPTLVMVGDSDIVRTEHAVELSRLIPQSQLAVLPATDHIAIILQRAGWMTDMIGEFLDVQPETAGQNPQSPPADGKGHDFPKSIGNPATDALLAAGYTRLEQLTRVKESDIKALHGVGPKALKILRETLAEKGLAFAG